MSYEERLAACREECIMKCPASVGMSMKEVTPLEVIEVLNEIARNHQLPHRCQIIGMGHIFMVNSEKSGESFEVRK